MADLVKLTAPNGSTVSVSKERAERLLETGYTKVESKTTAKKSSSTKK
jgi:hypothetical protein